MMYKLLISLVLSTTLVAACGSEGKIPLEGSPLLATGTLPMITSTSGVISNNGSLLITGSNFSAKINAAPLFFWTADGGKKPSDLGRKSNWDGVFNGTFVSAKDPNAIIAPGSSMSVKLDHSLTEAAILGRIDFSSDKLYIWRKKYDDFNINTDQVIRTRYNNEIVLVSGSTLSQGQIVKGVKSGATGVIQSIGYKNPHNFILYEKSGGTINDPTPLDFDNGEAMNVYSSSDTGFVTALIKVTNTDGRTGGDGVFRDLNYKIMRFWSDIGVTKNDMYLTLGNRNGSNAVVAENTGVSSYYVKNWENPLYQRKGKWDVEEVLYQTSSIDKQDGVTLFFRNNQVGWLHRRWRHRTSRYPGKYKQLFQTQISNGAQPGSSTFFDSLYIDDTWHRVIICTSKTWVDCKRPEIQIPEAWNDRHITIKLRLPNFTNKNIYLYIFNKKGLHNENGYHLKK